MELMPSRDLGELAQIWTGRRLLAKASAAEFMPAVVIVGCIESKSLRNPQARARICAVCRLDNVSIDMDPHSVEPQRRRCRQSARQRGADVSRHGGVRS